MTEPELPRWAPLASAAYAAFVLVLYGSAFAAFVFESRVLALTAVALLTAQFGLHLSVSVFEYRRTMRRPWPAVPPLEDDDD